jgi:hypothetical protein
MISKPSRDPRQLINSYRSWAFWINDHAYSVRAELGRSQGILRPRNTANFNPDFLQGGS